MNLGCESIADASTPHFIKNSLELNTELLKLSESDISEMMSISEKLSQAVHGYIHNWTVPFTSDNAKPAALIFSGDVYDGLDAASLTDTDRDYAQGVVRILSGLYGVLKPFDLIQPYRLEMGRKIETSNGSNLYQYWGSKIAQKLNSECDDFIVNLASNEYFKAAKVKEITSAVITPVFKDTSKGKLKVISFYAKKARGLMARYIVTNQIETIEGLKAFNTSGYEFKQDLSSETELVFTRPQQG